MVKVKICGITNVEDALLAFEYGADLLGFIFVKGTPRYVENVSDIIKDLPAELKDKGGIAGVFRDEKPEVVVETVARCGLDHVQLHGEESPDYCRALKEALLEGHGPGVRIMKTFKVKEKILPHGSCAFGDYEDADYFLFDTFHPGLPGGTGLRFDREALIREKDKIKKPFFIAGGLTPGNVSEAVRAVRPHGVDVSSGVERSPGKKGRDLLKEFIENAKNA